MDSLRPDTCREVDQVHEAVGTLKVTVEVYDSIKWENQSGISLRERWRFFTSGGGGRPIGHGDVVFEPTGAHFDDIKIEEEYRGKGIGMEIYLTAIDRAHQMGLPFVAQDAGQSEDAKRIWDKLVASGVAQEYKPFVEPTLLINGHKKYFGRYIAPPYRVQ